MGLRQLKKGAFVAACAALVCNAMHAAPPELVEATRQGSAFPDVPDDVDEAQAYRWQRELVAELYGESIAGIKAGLTSIPSQRRFGASQPVLGVLPANGEIVGGRVDLVPGLKIELEVGYRLKDATGTRADVFPAIELPRLDYADMSRVTSVDIVATNVAAYRYILGKSQQEPAELASLRAVLTRDGAKVAEGTAADALGDPRTSADWVVSKAHVLGYPLHEGTIVITGAMGPMVDAVPGRYRADFGALGTIEFAIGASKEPVTQQAQMHQTQRSGG